MSAVRSSVTAKVCFFIAVTEAVLLSVLGVILHRGYAAELEHGLVEKMSLPAALMSQMAMNFEAAADLPALGVIVGEPVVEAFVARKDRTVFYASDAGRIGTKAAEVPADAPAIGRGGDRVLRRTSEAVGERISLLTTMRIDGEVIGYLFVKVDSRGVVAMERALAAFLAGGAALTILLTTLIAAFWVRRLLVPRIDRTVDTLRLVGEGRLSSRVDGLGAPDQIGFLMVSVNAMIARVETHTRNLQTLADAGAAFANAEDRPNLQRALVRVLEAHFAAVGDEAGREGDAIFMRTLGRLLSDATERIDALARLRGAEREYRELFLNALEGIFRISPAGRLETVNASFTATFGFPDTGDPLAWFDGFLEARPEVHARWAAFLRRVSAEGEVRNAELSFTRDDGTPACVSVSARSVDVGGRRGIEGGVVEISERKRLEAAEAQRAAAEAAHLAKSEVLAAIEEKNAQLENALTQLQRTQAKLLQSEKMAAMGTMAAGVAHDLNNILSGIVGYPDLMLLELPESSPWREGLTVIKESGERAAAVVADLLTIARGAAYVTEPCDLNRLIGKYLQSPECLHLMRRFPGVRIVSQPAGDLVAATCSPVHIQKVVMNLVMNACEAIHETGVVRISTGNAAVGPNDALALSVPPGGYVVVSVADSGPGIPEKDLPRIFEPFFSKKILGRSGTGLGLAVVWNTVTEHGGAVVAGSGREGAVFTVYLPAAGAIPENGRRAEPASAALQGTARILVVDDEPLLRQIATKILTKLGYRVETASSGEEAIARLKEEPFDLLLLDMLMPPGIGGSEAYREIARLRPGQKAVICSGFSATEDYLEARKCGAGAFLKKPYTLEELGLAVKRELERPAGATSGTA